jgi:superfamily II DNA or RNA helicase
VRDVVPLPVREGDLTRVRRVRWRVDAVRREAALAFVRLRATDFAASRRTLLHPYDRFAPLRAASRIRPVSTRRWMRALRTAIIESCPYEALPSALDAPAELLPFQLEPLLALRSGLASRLLIADEVGLGKTVQAALIARDVRCTSDRASILVLTPASLREQWRDELQSRASLDAVVLDAGTLRSLVRSMPADADPWRLFPIAIASIDFVKQPDILHSLRQTRWSLLVVDEAHALTLGTDRLDAARALAFRSERIVLLTATPHDGSDATFQALCDLGRYGAHDTPMAVFRRSAAEVGLARTRRSTILRIEQGPSEARLHGLLDAYVQRVWKLAPRDGTPPGSLAPAKLAMTVLVKRATSSPWALQRSLYRRRALLGLTSEGWAQSPLPFESTDSGFLPTDDQEPDRVLAAAGLDPAHERVWLNVLIDATHRAIQEDRKTTALVRLLRRARQPALVFTEYRDTLERLASAVASLAPIALLHGGLTTEARRLALHRFASGEAQVLLCTDAASEGMNLHERCRLAISLERPWNPNRLEQRIGRVDRLGQTRTVHAILLVGRGTFEERFESRFNAKMVRIQDAIDTAQADSRTTDPARSARWTREEPSTLEAAFATSDGTSGNPAATPQANTVNRAAENAAGCFWPDLRVQAASAASELRLRRALRPPSSSRTRATAHVGSPVAGTVLWTRLRRAARRRLSRMGRVICVLLTRIRDGDGAIVEQSLTPVLLDGWFEGRSLTTLTLGRLSIELKRGIEPTIAARVRRLSAICSRHARLLTSRRLDMVRALGVDLQPCQPLLFEGFDGAKNAPYRESLTGYRAAAAEIGRGEQAADLVAESELTLILFTGH